MSNPAFLQGATHSLYGAGPATVAFPSNTVAGDLLLVLGYSGILNDTLSINDSVNTWTSINYTGGISGNVGATQLWYAIAVGGASTVSISSSGGAASRNVTIGEWSANGNTFTLDKSALTSAGDTTYTSLTSSSVSTTQANELLIGAFMSSGNVTTWTAGSNYNIQKQGNSGPSTVFEDQLVSSTNSYSASVTLTSTLGGVAKGIVTFAFAPSGGGVSTTLAAAPVPATVVNSSGYSLPITSPTLGTKLGQPNPICFCDANGNELAVTGSTKGAFVKGALPVVLCDSIGHPLAAPFVFTSNGNSITVSATPTGIKLGQPIPVVATDFNGFPYILSGFTLGSMAGNPTAITLCDINGNVLTLSGIAT